MRTVKLFKTNQYDLFNSFDFRIEFEKMAETENERQEEAPRRNSDDQARVLL